MNAKNLVPQDALTAIKGIGASRQRWFQQTFDVRTYQDLANLSAEDIETRLKAEGKIVSRAEIETWIAQAEHLATSTVKDDGWQPIASFVVEFQEQETETGIVEQRTTVHHVETDHTFQWEGIQENLLCRWMSEQLGDKAPPLSLTDSPKPSLVVEESRLEQAIAKMEALTAPSSVPPFAELPEADESAIEAVKVLTPPPAEAKRNLSDVIAKVQQLSGQPMPPPAPTLPKRNLQDVMNKVQQLTTKTPTAPPKAAVVSAPQAAQPSTIPPRIQRLMEKLQQGKR